MSASINRQAGGYKATINNPTHSEETKNSAREKLENLEATSETSNSHGSSGRENVMAGKNEGNVLSGYKATLKNPRVSDEAKHNAEEILKEHDAL